MSAVIHSKRPTDLAEENRRLREALARAQQQIDRGRAQIAKLRQRIRGVATTARLWAWEGDANGAFLWDINRPPELGLSDVPIEQLRERYFQLIDPAALARLAVDRCAALERKASFITYRHRVALPDGTTRVMEGRGAFLYGADGELERVVGITADVTREVEATELLQRQADELRDAHRRLERASLSSQEGHWEFDSRTERFWLSSSYFALLGYATGEVEAGTLEQHAELVHPEDRARELSAVMDHLRYGRSLDVQIRMRHADGRWRWIRLRGKAEFDATARPLRVCGSIQDIHQHKLVEDSLKAARQRFERAIRGTQDGLWEADLEHDTFWASPRYEAILGYGEGEMPLDLAHHQSITHPQDLPRVIAARQAHFDHNVPFDIELRLRHTNGQYIWIRTRGEAERDAHGTPVRLAGSMQDVTEARAARDALIQATKAAQAANQAKSEFLANVSHEIRTPMNGIIGMTSLLLDTRLERTQLDYAETIRSSADSLLRVINDILDFSKIEAGKLDIETLEMDLRANVEDVGAAMAFQAAAKNLELIVNVSPALPTHVTADPQRIRQCLVNLVGNAIKFTERGEIVVEVNALGRRDGKVLAHFEVRDTGIGVSPETAKTLFQPFVQADSSTTRHFGGTGLGLSIVRRLVEMMGGQVGMQSEPGQGSTFWFTLPLSIGEPTGVQRAPRGAACGKRVLVVDDNATNRGVLAGQLIPAGYEVTLASSGPEALLLLRQAAREERVFDVALTDLQMPEMDGAMLGRQINADPNLSGVRMVMLTSLDRQGDREDFAALGFAAYLTKPVRTRELLECMEKVLASDAQVWHTQTLPIITHSRLREEAGAARYCGHVLLVEDNAVNQKVALRFLERLGCRVTIASNGVEGVSACERERFDLVLMDLQMPLMDGLTATARIRALDTGSSQVPIVALTANAMPGQLERCLEADMNGLLTKPLVVERLKEILDCFGLLQDVEPPSSDLAAAATALADAEAPPLLDPAKFAEMTDGDAEFAREISAAFLASSEQALAEMRVHAAAGDTRRLAGTAHKLKGAAASIHAVRLRELCATLESADVDPARQSTRVEAIARALELTVAELQRHVPNADLAV